MTLDIVLLIATIVVAVLALVLSLIQAALSRRGSGDPWVQRGPRKVDAGRLGRAVPPPVRSNPSPAMAARRLASNAMAARIAEQAALRAEAAAMLTAATPTIAEVVAAGPEVEAPSPEAPPIADLDEPTAIPVSAEAPVEAITVEDGSAVEAPPEVVEEAAPETLAAEEPDLETAAAAEAGAVVAEEEPEPVLEPEPVALVASASEPEPAPDVAEPAPADEPRERVPERAAAAFVPVVAASAPAAWRFGPPPQAVPESETEDELAYRIGVPGARPAARPAVIVVAGGEKREAYLSPVATEAWPKPQRRRRRAAFRVAAVAAMLASVMTAVLVIPDLGDQSGVLSETGRPPASGGGVVALETPSAVPPSDSPVPVASASPTPAPSASPSSLSSPASSPTPSSATNGTGGDTAAVTAPPPQAATPPPATAAPTARPTPSPAAPTARPTPTPTAAPTATPTAGGPTVQPSPRPVAVFTCVTAILVVTCTGADSGNAEGYSWTFGDGAKADGMLVTHVYKGIGCYLVRLTVNNSRGTDVDGQFILVGVNGCSSPNTQH